jgi:hypothetical protein
MLAFAVVFWPLIDRTVPGAFVGASLAWIVVSVAAWFARRKCRLIRRPERNRDPAMPRRRLGRE